MLPISKISLRKMSYAKSRWRWSNANLSLHDEFLLYIFSNPNGIEKSDICWQKFLILFNSLTRSTCCNLRLDIMMKRWKYRMTNILNCHVIYYKFRSSRKQKQRPLEAQALNFRVLMDCLNQENLRKLKGAVSLNVY